MTKQNKDFFLLEWTVPNLKSSITTCLHTKDTNLQWAPADNFHPVQLKADLSQANADMKKTAFQAMTLVLAIVWIFYRIHQTNNKT